MFKIFCVTNRHVCHGDYLTRIRNLVECRMLSGLILREKDMSENEYRALAAQVCRICESSDCLCVLHRFVDVAKEQNYRTVHLPMPILRSLSENTMREFDLLGTSCHSLKEAQEAEQLGCHYVIVGHLFPNACKRWQLGRGVNFLKSVCSGVDIPVYAIGGICIENITLIRDAGAAGACLMSSMMVCENPECYVKTLQERLEF